MTRKKLIISTEQIKYCLIFFFLIKPDYFSFIGKFTILYNIGFLVSLAYVLIKELSKFTIKRTAVLIYAITLFPLIVSLIEGVELTQSVFIPVLQTIGLVAAMSSVSKNNLSGMLFGLSFILKIYTYINFFSVIFFPNGLYEEEIYSGNYWFLGYKNVMVRFLIPAIVINAIYTVYKKKRYDISLYILTAISVATLWIVDCKTGVIGIGIIIFTMIVFARRNLPKFFNAKNGLIAVGVLSVALGTTSLLDDFSEIFSSLGETVSVFSRQTVWFRAIQLFLKSPILGYGLRTNDGYRELINLSTGWGYFSHPHNYLLFILIQGGLIEVLLIVIFLTKVSRLCLANRDNYMTKMLLVYYIAFFVMGITESLVGCTLLYPVALLAEYCQDLDVRYTYI